MSKDRIQSAIRDTEQSINALLPYVAAMSPSTQKTLEYHIRLHEFLTRQLGAAQ